MEQGFLSVYTAKAAEYLLAVGYLLFFIPFWKYVQGGQRQSVAMEAGAGAAARARAQPRAARAAGATAPHPTAGWFQLPAGVHLHPGHTWARLEPDGLVAVGMDDFAHKLVGPAAFELPELGERVAQGETALAIGDLERKVPMLSPVDGTVVAVNAAARERPESVDGAGWLFKVKPDRLAANLRQLLSDNAARRFLEDAGDAIAFRMSPQLATVLQDGGAPIHGIARAVAGDDWDQLARKHFLA